MAIFPVFLLILKRHKYIIKHPLTQVFYHLKVDDEEKKFIRDTLRKYHQCYPVFLSPKEVEDYYNGFSNRAIWPLFHYFTSACSFKESEWKVYEEVNRKFYKEIIRLARDPDQFWIHDYHLMLLPRLVRKRYPQNAIGFFLHIPFPSSEIFRILPWRNEILEGLLGSDLLGFHTYEYARHFSSSVLRILGCEQEFGSIFVKDRTVKVENFPMGIDFQHYQDSFYNPSIQEEILQVQRQSLML